MTHSPAGKIILVRHGETEANQRRCFADSDDIPLTETGRLQAHEVGLRLRREFNPDALISSEFLRARQTSEIIGRVLGLETELITGIHERDFGYLKGHPYERLGELMSKDRLPDQATEPWTWRPECGECLDAVRLRAIQAMEALRVRYPGQEIVVVSHGAVIQAICAHITCEWNEASVPPNCGIVTVEYNARVWKVPILSGRSDMIHRSPSS
jgi:broad specificity phosphatase PhoE